MRRRAFAARRAGEASPDVQRLSGLPPGFQSWDQPPPDESNLVGGEVPVAADHPAAGRIDPKSGAYVVDTPDGGVVIHLGGPPKPEPDDDGDWFANLADQISQDARFALVDEVLRGIEADDQSRLEWVEQRSKGISMLGLKIEETQQDAGSGVSPFEGMAGIRHPLLLEAIARGQANAAAELYPPSGPVKVRDDRPSKPQGAVELPPGLGHNGGPPLDDADPTNAAAVAQASREELAEALEKGFNHNLTVVDRAYRPDCMRMLFSVFFGGCAFRKIYEDPMRDRPVSRFVDAKDLIVSDKVSDLRDAERVTQRILMQRSVMRRMQISGWYRDFDLAQPNFQPDAVEEAVGEAQGFTARPQRQEDEPYTIYECYALLDVPGHEHTRRGQPTGLPLPWKLSIDKDSRELLELRRNWQQDDDTFQARQVFVKFGFIPAFGFYDIGLLHLLGNGEKALTAAWCEALDAGMFANFPGFLYNEGIIKNWTNQNRIPPGGGLAIKNVGNLPLDQVIKPLPYKEVGPGLIGLIEHIEERMDRVAGTAELPVGEGRQDAPVGTTLAMIEQATKILAAVHVGLHSSQAEELQLLKERYRENPSAFWRWNKRGYQWEEGLFLRALEDNEIVPAADPNTHSHMIRIMRAWAIVQLAQMAPQLFKPRDAARRFFEMIGVSDADEFLADEDALQAGQQPQLDPNTMAMVQQKAQEIQQRGQIEQAKLQGKAQENAADHQARMAEIQQTAAAAQRQRQDKAEEVAAESADRAAQRAANERIENAKLQATMARDMAQHGAGLSAPLPGAGV